MILFFKTSRNCDEFWNLRVLSNTLNILFLSQLEVFRNRKFSLVVTSVANHASCFAERAVHTVIGNRKLNCMTTGMTIKITRPQEHRAVVQLHIPDSLFRKHVNTNCGASAIVLRVVNVSFLPD